MGLCGPTGIAYFHRVYYWYQKAENRSSDRPIFFRLVGANQIEDGHPGI